MTNMVDGNGLCNGNERQSRDDRELLVLAVCDGDLGVRWGLQRVVHELHVLQLATQSEEWGEMNEEIISGVLRGFEHRIEVLAEIAGRQEAEIERLRTCLRSAAVPARADVAPPDEPVEDAQDDAQAPHSSETRLVAGSPATATPKAG